MASTSHQATPIATQACTPTPQKSRRVRSYTPAQKEARKARREEAESRRKELAAEEQQKKEAKRLQKNKAERERKQRLREQSLKMKDLDSFEMELMARRSSDKAETKSLIAQQVNVNEKTTDELHVQGENLTKQGENLTKHGENLTKHGENLSTQSAINKATLGELKDLRKSEEESHVRDLQRLAAIRASRSSTPLKPAATPSFVAPSPSEPVFASAPSNNNTNTGVFPAAAAPGANAQGPPPPAFASAPGANAQSPPLSSAPSATNSTNGNNGITNTAAAQQPDPLLGEYNFDAPNQVQRPVVVDEFLWTHNSWKCYGVQIKEVRNDGGAPYYMVIDKPNGEWKNVDKVFETEALAQASFKKERVYKADRDAAQAAAKANQAGASNGNQAATSNTNTNGNPFTPSGAAANDNTNKGTHVPPFSSPAAASANAPSFTGTPFFFSPTTSVPHNGPPFSSSATNNAAPSFTGIPQSATPNVATGTPQNTTPAATMFQVYLGKKATSSARKRPSSQARIRAMKNSSNGRRRQGKENRPASAFEWAKNQKK